MAVFVSTGKGRFLGVYFLCFFLICFVLYRYFSRAMVERLILQFTEYFSCTVADGCFRLFNMAEIRHVKNENNNTSNSGEKIKVTRLMKWLPCFFKWLQRVLLGELQISKALRYRFENFQQYNSNKPWSKRCLLSFCAVDLQKSNILLQYD